MSNLQFCGFKNRYSYCENNLGLFDVIDTVTGSVVQSFKTRTEAFYLYYKLDIIFKNEPIQLSLF